MFSLIFAWIDGWVNNRDAGDLRRHRSNDDVTVMISHISKPVLFPVALLLLSNQRQDCLCLPVIVECLIGHSRGR